MFFCDEHSLPIASGTPVDVCWKYDISGGYGAHASILVPASARAAKAMQDTRVSPCIGETRGVRGWQSGISEGWPRVGIDARVFLHYSDDFQIFV